MKKKIISLLLITSFMLSFIPCLAGQSFAAEESTVLEQVYGDKSAEEKIADAIEALRGYYLNGDDDFTHLVSLAYHFISDKLENDLHIIQQRFKVNENPDSASACVKNIMGLLAAGKDPRDYNGKNYIKTLAEKQKDDGFIIKNGDDYPTTIAFSMLALDMAREDYDVEKAVEALLKYQDDDGGFGGKDKDGNIYSSVDDTAICLMALGNHRNKGIEGLESAITKGLAYIKANQKPFGGFEAWGEENPYSVSAVIQCLIALGEAPLSEEWTKNGNTLLDALLSFMVDDHFENPSQWGTEIEMATEQAFCALADLYRGKSMFHEINIKDAKPHEVKILAASDRTIKEKSTLRLAAFVYDDKGNILLGHNLLWESSDPTAVEVDNDGLVTAKSVDTVTKVTITAKVKGYEDVKDTIELTVKPEEFKVTRIDTGKIKKGREARLEFKIQENLGESRSVTLIVALYDKNTNKMVNYAFVTKEFHAGETANLGAGFLVPESGNYLVRCFVWDSFENQDIILANPIEIEVKQ